VNFPANPVRSDIHHEDGKNTKKEVRRNTAQAPQRQR